MAQFECSAARGLGSSFPEPLQARAVPVSSMNLDSGAGFRQTEIVEVSRQLRQHEPNELGGAMNAIADVASGIASVFVCCRMEASGALHSSVSSSQSSI